MTALLYIMRNDDMIRFGRPSAVMLDEPLGVSRTWISETTVELPAGFEVCQMADGHHGVYRGSDYYPLAADAHGSPVLIDPSRGNYIRLPVIEEVP